jgi:hypothetical protein
MNELKLPRFTDEADVQRLLETFERTRWATIDGE